MGAEMNLTWAILSLLLICGIAAYFCINYPYRSIVSTPPSGSCKPGLMIDVVRKDGTVEHYACLGQWNPAK